MKLSISRFESVRLMKWPPLADDDGLLERALDLGVEDDAAGRGQDQLAVPAVLDRVLEADLADSTWNSTSSSFWKRLIPSTFSSLASASASTERSCRSR